MITIKGAEFAIQIKGLMKKEVAEQLGVSPQIFNMYTKGKRNMPPEKLIQLSQILGVPKQYLIKTELTITDEVEIRKVLEGMESQEASINEGYIPRILNALEKFLRDDTFIRTGNKPNGDPRGILVSDESIRIMDHLIHILNQFTKDYNFNKVLSVRYLFMLLTLENTDWKTNMEMKEAEGNDLWKDMFYVLKKHGILDGTGVEGLEITTEKVKPATNNQQENNNDKG